MIAKIKFWFFGLQNIDIIILFKSLKKLDGFDFLDFINFIKSRNIKDFVIIEKKFTTIFCQSVFDLMGQTLTNEQAEQVHNVIMYNRLTIFEKIKFNINNLKTNLMKNKKPNKAEIKANIELLENNKIENLPIEILPIENVTDENVTDENVETETERQNVGSELMEDIKKSFEESISEIIINGKKETFLHLTLEQFNEGKKNFMSIDGNNFKVEKLNIENCYKVDFIVKGKNERTQFVKLIK